MLSEQFEKLIIHMTAFNEEVMAEKLAKVISVVLPKMIKREIEKGLNMENHTKLCHGKKPNLNESPDVLPGKEVDQGS